MEKIDKEKERELLDAEIRLAVQKLEEIVKAEMPKSWRNKKKPKKEEKMTKRTQHPTFFPEVTKEELKDMEEVLLWEARHRSRGYVLTFRRLRWLFGDGDEVVEKALQNLEQEKGLVRVPKGYQLTDFGKKEVDRIFDSLEV